MKRRSDRRSQVFNQTEIKEPDELRLRLKNGVTLHPGGIATGYLVHISRDGGDFVDTDIEYTVYDRHDKMGATSPRTGADFGVNFKLAGEIVRARLNSSSGQYETVGSEGLVRIGQAEENITSGNSGNFSVNTSAASSSCTGTDSLTVSACVKQDFSTNDWAILAYIPSMKNWFATPMVQSGGAGGNNLTILRANSVFRPGAESVSMDKYDLAGGDWSDSSTDVDAYNQTNDVFLLPDEFITAWMVSGSHYELIGPKGLHRRAKLLQDLDINETGLLKIVQDEFIDTLDPEQYQWTASGSGTNEYYLEAAAGGDPGIQSQPGLFIQDGCKLVNTSAGTLEPGEWDYGDNDSLGYSTLYVVLISNEVDLLDSAYQWTESPATSGEYYIELSGGGDPSLSEPDSVVENWITITEGTVGSLGAGEWDWGDNDTLGYSTIYIKLTAGGDPDTAGLNALSSREAGGDPDAGGAQSLRAVTCDGEETEVKITACNGADYGDVGETGLRKIFKDEIVGVEHHEGHWRITDVQRILLFGKLKQLSPPANTTLATNTTGTFEVWKLVGTTFSIWTDKEITAINKLGVTIETDHGRLYEFKYFANADHPLINVLEWTECNS